MIRPIALGLVAALLATGCGPQYAGLELELVRSELGSFATAAKIELAEGGLLLIKARPIGQRREYDGLEDLTLDADDPEIARISMSVLNDGWMITGQAVGTTEVNVRIDDVLEDTIPLEVREQELISEDAP